MSRFVIEHATEGTLVCDVTSRVTKAMIAKLAVHAAATVVVLLSQTFLICTAPNDPISWFRALDVAVLYMKAMRVSCLSSRFIIEMAGY